MKTRCRQLFFLTLLFVSAASVGALAQEAGMSDSEIINEGVVYDEKGAFIPGEELRYSPRSAGLVMAKDSVVLQMHDFRMQRVAQKPAEKAADKQNTRPKDDSILTFNFLYYIIQKYKLQDVID